MNKRILYLLLVAILTGCASASPPESSTTPNRDQEIRVVFDETETHVAVVAEMTGNPLAADNARVEAGKETVKVSILTDRLERFSGWPCAPLQAPYFGPCAPAYSSTETMFAPLRHPGKGLPYFGERLPQMPPNHFTTPLVPEIPPLVRDGD